MSVSAHLKHVRPTTKIINEKFPYGQIIRSTTEGGLYLPMLPSKTRQSHILPNIKHSILSLGSLCDAGCTVTFCIKYVTVFYKNNIILQGWIKHHNKLWYLLLSVDSEDEKVGDKKNPSEHCLRKEKNKS